jgi:hypothetical protein
MCLTAQKENYARHSPLFGESKWMRMLQIIVTGFVLLYPTYKT